MKNFLCRILLLFGWMGAGCQSRTGAPRHHPADTVIQAGTPQLNYHRYTGTIGRYPIVVHLEATEQGIAGYYYYRNVGQPIALMYLPEDTGGLVLEEYTPEQDEGPKWRLPGATTVVQGQWVDTRKGSTLPLYLKEEYPAGSVPLDLVRRTDSAVLRPGLAHSPKATSSTELIVPADGMPDSARAFLQSVLLDHLGQKKVTGKVDWQQVMQAMANDDFADYRSDLSPETVDDSAADDFSSYNYSYSVRQRVLMNEDDWVVLESINYAYSGGAHGNYGSSFLNLDLRNRRDWQLDDVFSDTASLLPLLDATARSYFGIGSGASLSDRLLVEMVPLTANFYVAPGGIAFVYNPYEIASYADGEVTLFLPYARLTPFLTEAFKDRMHLVAGHGMAMRDAAPRKEFLCRSAGRL